jgi:hydroxymethylglutaryl-CoA synthase
MPLKAGIVGYGCYIPRYRITVDEIASVWGADVNRIKKGLLVEEKAVAGDDEDTATIAVEAAKNALKRAEIDPKLIGAVYVGSESHPYAVKPTATIVGEALGIGNDYTAADLEFACKAGTAGIQAALGLVESEIIEYGLAIGADTAQGAPGDALEYTAASGGAAFIIGKENVLAKILATCSYSSDTPDFWRRPFEKYPSHGSRFTGEPAYFRHVVNAAKLLCEKVNMQPNEFDHVVFHMPNGKSPLRAAKLLGIPSEKLKAGFVVTKVGNTYSGCSLLGLCAVLDKANAGETILLVSYGSGAGSDAFAFETTELLLERRNKAPFVEDYIQNKIYVSYTRYAKMRGKIG